MLSRYTRWDGTQEPFGRDADELFDRLAEDLFQGADFDYALHRLLSRGWRDQRGKRLPGFDEMLERLRAKRQQQLKRYNLNDVFGNIRERLNDILRRERQGIDDRIRQAPDHAKRVVEKIAKKKQEELDRLPDDVGGAIRALNDYEFMDESAAAAFQQLMEELKQQVTQTYFRNMTQTMQQLNTQDLGEIKAMMKALNQMLRDRLEGRTPDFDGFMKRFGHFFGPNPPKTLDELVQQLERQMAQMESLMQSLSPEQRAAMEELIASTLSDPELQAEMAELAAALELLSPRPQLGNRYAFYGSESLPLQEALSLMERLQSIEGLEQALREGYQGQQLTPQQSQQLQELLGPEARQAADQISELAAQLERKGYVQRGRRGMELTPRGMRRIGQKALKDLYSRLKRDRFGDHPISVRGLGSEHADETKAYEFGDAFNLHVERTLMNALRRDGPERPVRLRTDDFEVFRSEFSTQSSTVLMIDMSRSMPLRGYFYAAKKVALALDALIRSQFPRDHLQVIAFSDLARPVKPAQLAELTYNESIYGTNIQHGLMLARQFLNRYKTGNKQVIIVTDGEPTAHMEGQTPVFFYPPLPETFQKTLLEVQRCTREHIVINTFMLDNDYHLVSFVKQMTRLNGGRAFFASADRLGDYVLLDYVDRKRKSSR
ncbi:MAG TPA: VWA domain-containing protein [Candidatus Limnocylindrales bacterium]|nr:VWA domain-containing protein [Candidatus Limnocylindrales bacterium]